ncbi:hypothetical protein P3M90_002447 [Salmonella enterica]|uniref:Uncharacterized protein n=3 Tax=Salmonella houtenae TaxID=59205 RepID=A0A702LUD0_SALHO|nr:hypothetical protein [Salmonella enterica subsp. houtenae]EAB2652639.1 hypothetical protein [Salmonella enterica]ECH8280240.1 hypothetical protein [Salmonella enterica subsp. enterica]EEH1859525.1 hypothetical protein [Salmonella enterica subsp. houtenae serovar 50:g,z51:-]ESE84680.1 hypothetical protein SEH50133_17634 [Salmonella enterica subsp. houtenae serovar 50:g,z51:- str. 01-0133]HAC6519283.1 hypothetical protein [Salmonella enterica subsp. houtenae serovar 45:g,z51:-]HAE7576512.1 h
MNYDVEISRKLSVHEYENAILLRQYNLIKDLTRAIEFITKDNPANWSCPDGEGLRSLEKRMSNVGMIFEEMVSNQNLIDDARREREMKIQYASNDNCSG